MCSDKCYLTAPGQYLLILAIGRKGGGLLNSGYFQSTRKGTENNFGFYAKLQPILYFLCNETQKKKNLVE